MDHFWTCSLNKEDDLKMQLNKDFSCGGLELENPRFLGGGEAGHGAPSEWDA